MKRDDDQFYQDTISRDKPGINTVIKTYFLRHAQVFFYSIGQLWRTPLSLFMTAAVIGIALALPTGMHLLLKNAQTISGGWDGAAKISLFLKKSTDEDQARTLTGKLKALAEVAEVEFISREKGLAEFKQRTGYGDAITALDDNPIPHLIVVTPVLQHSDADQMEKLAGRFRTYKDVEFVQLDQEWVQRLYAIMDIVSQAVVILGFMISLAVLLVVGNTIRLAIQNRRDEIVIVKLIGGTDAFIRRPFLYTGFWYGLCGGIIALILVYIALFLMSSPVERLAGLYQTPFSLHKMDFGTIITILAMSIGLGLGGSWIAVGRHLREIEPH